MSETRIPYLISEEAYEPARKTHDWLRGKIAAGLSKFLPEGVTIPTPPGASPQVIPSQNIKIDPQRIAGFMASLGIPPNAKAASEAALNTAMTPAVVRMKTSTDTFPGLKQGDVAYVSWLDNLTRTPKAYDVYQQFKAEPNRTTYGIPTTPGSNSPKSVLREFEEAIRIAESLKAKYIDAYTLTSSAKTSQKAGQAIPSRPMRQYWDSLPKHNFGGHELISVAEAKELLSSPANISEALKKVKSLDTQRKFQLVREPLSQQDALDNLSSNMGSNTAYVTKSKELEKWTPEYLDDLVKRKQLTPEQKTEMLDYVANYQKPERVQVTPARETIARTQTPSSTQTPLRSSFASPDNPPFQGEWIEYPLGHDDRIGRRYDARHTMTDIAPTNPANPADIRTIVGETANRARRSQEALSNPLSQTHLAAAVDHLNNLDPGGFGVRRLLEGRGPAQQLPRAVELVKSDPNLRTIINNIRRGEAGSMRYAELNTHYDALTSYLRNTYPENYWDLNDALRDIATSPIAERLIR